MLGEWLSRRSRNWHSSGTRAALDIRDEHCDD
jgi:hypothetical protein